MHPPQRCALHTAWPLFLWGCGPLSLSEPEQPAPPDQDSATWESVVGARLGAELSLIREDDSGFFASQGLMGIHARFDGSGAHLFAGDDSVNLTMASWGREGAAAPLSPASPAWGDCAPDLFDLQENCITRLEYSRDSLLEWWVSSPGRLQTGWDLLERPNGAGEVEINLSVGGAVVSQADDGGSLWFTTPSRKLLFTGLFATDAEGTVVEAWMEPAPGGLRVVVDDTDAVYPIHVDPLTYSSAWSTTGSTSYQLGKGVGGAGDVNNDGYDDVIVGAPGYSSGTGRAYIFHGSSTGLSTAPSSTLTGPAGGSNFGAATRTAGDVNNDGYADVVVGAYTAGGYQGAAYIYHGSATGISSTAARSLTASGGYFGEHVSPAGDVNGDGYDDIAIGAQYYASYVGRAYIYLGSASGIGSTASTTITGASYDYMGREVAGGGDFNNDGYDDVAVAYTDGVKVYCGSSTGVSTTPCTALAAPVTGVGFGSGTSVGGDINSDGYDDLVVGCCDAIPASSIYIYYGTATGLPGTAGTSIASYSSSYFGSHTAGIGDVNNDGYADIAISAYAGSGSFKVYAGGSTGLNTTYIGESSGTSTAYHGWDMAAAGDVNADGIDDFVVGAPGAYGTSAGAAYLYSGTTDADGDGYESGSGATGDCNDSDAAVHPGATEITGDGVDQNCDGAETCYDDDDNDGYLDTTGDTRASTDTDCADAYEGTSSDLTTDCSDSNAARYPGATEIVANGVDEDCDTYESCYDDDDNDGYLDTSGDTRLSADSDCADAYEGTSTDATTDCDDTSSVIRPGVAEVTGDGVDQNCDGAETCYDDDDNDGFLDTTGDTRASTDTDCADAYEGTTSDLTTDCSDSSAARYPGATEIVGDGIDEDCDNAEVCYDDDDNDGYLDSSGDTRVSTDSDCTDAYEGTSSDPTTDCDDTSSAFKPSATEIAGDETDQNCDGMETCYDDDDDDGFLDTSGDTRVSTDVDCDDAYEGTSSDLTTDCSDSSATRYPGAPEVVGDSIDEDCNNAEICYDDADNDGYLDTSGTTRASTDSDCSDAYEGTSTDATTDCDDTSSAIRPGAAEVTGDGVDQNCDGAETCYDDDDDDGFIDITADIRVSTDADCDDAFEALSTALTTDCDDTLASVYPGATEIIGDGVDEDCDNAEICFDDADNDGYLDTSGDTRTSTDRDCSDANEGTNADPTTDCDDTSALINPGVAENTGDGVDQDCDGGESCWHDADDDGFLDGGGAVLVSVDADCDDINEGLSTDPSTDCDDTNASAFPGATEAAGNGADEDCDGFELCFSDNDDDGFLDTSGATRTSADVDCEDSLEGKLGDPTTDCDDAASAVYPGATEVPANSIDEDCDGTELCYVDDDGDTFGIEETVVSTDLACDAVGESTNTTDCDAENRLAFPGAPENIADGVDQDCDGLETCYFDGDLDGEGSEGTLLSANYACDGLGESATGTDCDDTTAARSTAAVEIVANGIDENCDGSEECFTDEDLDGYGAPDLTVLSATLDCAAEGVSPADSDCDDSVASTFPGAVELPADGIDADCDGTELCFADDDADGHGRTDQVLSDIACSEAGSSPLSDDCNDGLPEVYPGALESAANGVDEDCDGLELCFADLDGDGSAGESTVSSANLACDAAGEFAEALDCHDDNGDVFPGAPEVCNDEDDNCDGAADEGIDCAAADSGVGSKDERSLCGCSSSSGVGALAWGALAAAALLRRRVGQQR